jgi:AraC-like DNA-binding protein
MLRPAASFHDLLERPLGRYARGDHFLVWCATRSLCGTLLWGRPTEEESRLLMSTIDCPIADGLRPPFDAVLDTRRLTGVDPAAFEVLVGATSGRRALYERVRRYAMIRTTGLAGAITAGLFHVIDPKFSWRVFARLDEALGWLDHPRPVELAARLDALVDDAQGRAPAIARLRDWLAARPQPRASLDDACRALGLSRRSMQRLLRVDGTSFRAEVDRARAQAAKRLLGETDLKLEAVAREIGCASMEAFIALFRRLTHQTPTEWRARHR